MYIKVLLFFFSMRYTLIFIYCYGFYFNLIGYIVFQLLIIFNFNFSRSQIEIQYYVCSIIHLLEFESALFYFFILSSQVFLSPRIMECFHRYHRQ